MWFESIGNIWQAFVATIFTWLVTAIGAFCVVFFKNINKKILSVILGFSAGVMIAASFWSLLLPALDLTVELGINEWFMPAIGFVFGGIFVLFSDKIMDKYIVKQERFTNSVSLKRSILLILAITIHNIPEGLAIGVAFGGISCGIQGMTIMGAIMLAVGIGIQNFPEGAAVSLPLRSEGYSRFKSFFLGQASAIVEPISAVCGAILASQIRSVLPLLLSFASGAMIVVVGRELLPEATVKSKNLSTIGLISGFILMMILDVALG